MSRATGSLSPSALRLPILHAVGDLTVYRLSATAPFSHLAEVAVKAALRPHPEAETARMAEAECWLDALEAPRSTVPVGLAAFYAQLDRLTVELASGAVAECLEGLQEEGLVRQVAGNKWSLTRASLETAVRARDVFTTKNMTAAWIDGTVDSEYLAKLDVHMGGRCKRSRQFNEISDLIHKFFLNLIRRDGLADMLAEGKHPTPSDLRNWAYRSALSSFRDEGRDALTRAFKGCRTEKDLRLDVEEEVGDAHRDTVDRSIPSEAAGVFLTEDSEGQAGTLVSGSSSAAPLLDVVGGNLEDEIIHRMTGLRGFALLEAAIRREKPGASDRFARILGMLREDKGFRDIGAAEGVSRNRAASLVADLRDAVNRAVATSTVAVRILKYVRDVPYATIEDMEEPRRIEHGENVGGLGEAVDVSILDALVAAGRLSREGDGCYLLTAAGASALDNEDEHFGIEIAADL